MLLGPLKNSMNETFGVKFTNDTVRCLGIYIGHNKERNKERNWVEKLEKIKIVFERWTKRSLTVFGKILVIKTLAVSKLIHSMSMLITPEDILQDLEKAIFKFLWDSHERIKRKTLIGSKENGGIKMLDVFFCFCFFCKNKSLKATWLKRLENENHNSAVVKMYLKKHNIDINYMAKTNISNPLLIQQLTGLPLFWAQVFGYANERKTITDEKLANASDLLSEPIWLNKRYKIAGKPIFISNWAKSQILFVKDVFDNTGNFINENQLLRQTSVKNQLDIRIY